MEKKDKIVNQSYTDPITGKFVKGNPGGGRPSGSLDFKTKWRIFVDKVAKQNNMTPNEIDEQLLAVGFKKAKEGDYNFYRDIHDRIYGKPNLTIGLEGGDESKPIQIEIIEGMLNKVYGSEDTGELHTDR